MKNVLITGACGGMGRATSALLAEKGYHVIGMDIAQTAEGFCGEYFCADVREEAAVESIKNMLEQSGTRLDAIIHMAGIYELDSLVEMSEEALLRVFDINLFGVCRVNRVFLPLLKENARIIITTSELAPLDPLPFTGIYGISKTALEKYAFSLRMELQLLGHKVIVLRPGAVKTGLLRISTDRLDRFCAKTKLYSCNAERFRNIVERVEARNVPAERIAQAAHKALIAKHPKYICSINRNPLLLLLHALPQRLQTWLIGRILKP